MTPASRPQRYSVKDCRALKSLGSIVGWCRCEGLMVRDLSISVLYSGSERKAVASRCVQCGDVLDPVISKTGRPQYLRIRGCRAPSAALHRGCLWAAAAILVKRSERVDVSTTPCSLGSLCSPDIAPISRISLSWRTIYAHRVY